MAPQTKAGSFPASAPVDNLSWSLARKASIPDTFPQFHFSGQPQKLAQARPGKVREEAGTRRDKQGQARRKKGDNISHVSLF